MPVHHVPAGLHAVTPYLIVEGADALITFLKAVFGAEELLRVPAPDGSVMHAKVRVGDSALELADAGAAWPAMACALHVYVPDVDATYARALAAGAKSTAEPSRRDYGERGAGVQDRWGNHWFIATNVEDLSDEEQLRRAAQHEKAGGEKTGGG